MKGLTYYSLLILLFISLANTFVAMASGIKHIFSLSYWIVYGSMMATITMAYLYLKNVK